MRNLGNLVAGFGIAAAVMMLAEAPLWMSSGLAPPMDRAVEYAEYLANTRDTALMMVLLHLGLCMTFMIFVVLLGHLVRRKEGCEWASSLMSGACTVWVLLILVADSLRGGAVLDTLGGRGDPSAVRALIEGTLLMDHGAVGAGATALFLAAAGISMLASNALPRWTAWLAWICAAACVAAIPSLYATVVDARGFYNPGGWGAAIGARVPLFVWISVASVFLLVSKPESTSVGSAAGYRAA